MAQEPKRSIYTEDGSNIHEYLPGGKYYTPPAAPARPATTPAAKVQATTPAKTNG